MRTFAVFTALALAASAQQSEVITGSASITSSASLSEASGSTNATESDSGPITHTIAVAKGGHSFSPDVTLAEVGDVIEYEFYPTNHSVVRAAYGHPCVPYEMILGAGHYGFWSDWLPVDAVLDDPPKWQVTVNDTEPIFFYCGAPNSCIGYGMVGVINPNASTSLEHQRQLAEASTFGLVPGEDWPSEGSVPSGVSTTSATPSATSSPPPATVTAVPPSDNGLSVGAIAGIAIGGAAVLLAAGVALWFCGRQSRRSQTPPPGAPAQVTNTSFMPAHGPTYDKPGHMSTVSGYTMPPGYEHQGMRSPTMTSMHTPVDPMMGQHPQMMHSGLPSPNLQHAAPAYGQNANMYAVGTHNVVPVEIDSSTTPASPRRSTEKLGVERYS